MKSKLGDKARLEHILEAIDDIEGFVKDINFENFINNPLYTSAVVRQFEIIGEAANKISNDLRDKFSEVDWKGISGFRNILIHEYYEVDYILVWNIIEAKLPELKQSIIKILNEIKENI